MGNPVVAVYVADAPDDSEQRLKRYNPFMIQFSNDNSTHHIEYSDPTLCMVDFSLLKFRQDSMLGALSLLQILEKGEEPFDSVLTITAMRGEVVRATLNSFLSKTGFALRPANPEIYTEFGAFALSNYLTTRRYGGSKALPQLIPQTPLMWSAAISPRVA